MPRTLIIAAFGVAVASCTDRTQSYSDAGREFARRLCAIQNDCDCADDIIIPDCEHQVAREVAESERQALNAGLVYDPECMEVFLAGVDDLGGCAVEYLDHGPLCPVYHGDAEVGEPCEIFDLMPRMYDCRVGLQCNHGVCRDPDNPAMLPLGAMCTTVPGPVPTPWLGTCDTGLQCDSLDTLTCIPSTSNPASLGGECTHAQECSDPNDNVCRPQDGDPQPSIERPGICVERTPPGELCPLGYECDWMCEAGICVAPPPMLCDTLRNWWSLRESL
jgi:hypothetical protein